MTTIHIVNLTNIGPVVFGTCNMHVQIPVNEVQRQVGHALARAGSGKPDGFFVMDAVGDVVTIKCLNGSETPYLLAALQERMVAAYEHPGIATSTTIEATLTNVEHWDRLADMG